MSLRAIDHASWKDYTDAFSRRHEGWLVSLIFQEPARDARHLAQNAPLRGLVAETHDGFDTIVVFTGGVGPATHFIRRAKTLEVEETTDGAEAALTLTDESGARTTLEFRSPMRPELVDGLA